MKKILILLVLILIVLFSTVQAATKPILIRIVTTQPADFELSPTYSAFFRFKDYVESTTNNRVKVELLMNGPLGPSEKSNFEALQIGTMQMAHTSEGTIPQFFRPVEVLSIPYLFKSETIAWRVLDGRFGIELSEAIARQTGVRVLAYTENGFRCFTNDIRPLRRPSDFKGIKMRTMESQFFITMFKALGAEPIPVPWMELYNALKFKVADGQENALSLILQARFYEVQKYLTLDDHSYGPHFIWINDKFYQSLPPDIKLAVYQGAKIAQTVHRGQQHSLHSHSIEIFKAKGMKIHYSTPAEKEMFRAATQPPVLEYLRKRVDNYWIDLLFKEVKKAEQAEAEVIKDKQNNKKFIFF